MLPVADPMFVTTTLEGESFYDNFDDWNYNGWGVWAGTWSAANGYLAQTSTATSRIVRSFTDANEISFLYNSQNTAYTAMVWLRAGGPGGGGLRLDLSPGNSRLVDAGVQRAWVATTTDQNQWYKVRIRQAGSYVEMWRGKVGEAMIKVFAVDTVTTLTSARLEFRINASAGAEFWFDNVRIDRWPNLGEFLHLQSDSPVIDVAKTLDDQNPPQPLGPYRDFDDQLSPIDGPQPPEEEDNENERDMGADEYPTNPAFSYWWRRF